MTIRYLDPPLHEFLPTKDEDIKELAADMGMTFDDLKNVVTSLHEFNPMMGHRGCRLAVTYPEIAAMQTRAVIKAALNVSAETGHVITPHIMIPLVGEVKELKFVKDVVVKVADELIAAAGVEMKYQVGTMIEIPRAALTAGEIAKEAEFFEHLPFMFCPCPRPARKLPANVQRPQIFCPSLPTKKSAKKESPYGLSFLFALSDAF